MANITSPLADMQDKPKVVFESTKEAVRLAQASLNRDMITHGGAVCMVPSWVLRVLVGCGQRQQEPAPCSGCGCEHDEIHNPTDTCATCNGGSRYHMPKPEPATLPESEDVAEALAEISAAGLKGVAVGLRLHIKGLARRLAEAEQGERNARRHALDLEKIERELTERLEAAEARVRELEALDNVPAEYGQCANCGAAVRISACREWTDDGEPCCCQECLDEHESLGCPLDGDGYRKNPRVSDLEAFKARVMEWARGGCGTCGTDAESEQCQECRNGYDIEEFPQAAQYADNWTPPQAWEVEE